MAKDVNAIQNWLALVVIVGIPRAFPIVSESISITLDWDDLLFYNMYRAPTSKVKKNAFQGLIDRGMGM